ncbi:MAG TPA: transcriptional regulator, partial [Sphingobacteriaceae bacterium]|nr:transcriptional regulator [Sphingobacteriaceae bacterium]
SSIGEIEDTAVASFLRAAIKSGRIYPDADKDGTVALLENLELITSEGKLKAAAVLLFGKKPMKYFISSYFKIGKFGTSDSDLRFQDTIEGNIFEMVDRVMRLLKERYLVSAISYDGIQRVEKLEYPEAALREAILNAIVHKDYTDSTIQLSVYDDKLILWNPGKLPDDLPIEKLKEKHASRPRNKHIAEVFFRAGYIESWGRGIDKILTTCREEGLPEPIFEEAWGGIQVTFLKDIYTEEYLSKLNLHDRQIKAVLQVKKLGKISNRKYQELFNVSRNTASRDLADLVEKKILQSSGDKGAGAFYSIK